MLKKYRFEFMAAFFTILLVSIGLSSTIITVIKTPSDRIPTLMWGHSDDYILYTSFIKEGIDGHNFVVNRTFPTPPKFSTIHILYIFIGKAASLFGLEAPIAYHVSRAVFGIAFILTTLWLFIILFQNKWLALWTTVIAFTSGPIGWFSLTNGNLSYNLSTWQFIDGSPSRPTTRPNYVFGAFIFTIIIISFIQTSQTISKKKIVIFFLLSVVLALVHQPSTVILLLVCGSNLVLLFKQRLQSTPSISLTPVVSIILGSLIGLLMSYWSMLQYPLIDWYSAIPKELVTTSVFSLKRWSYLKLQNFPQEFIAFGPLLWLGMLGFSWILFKKKGLLNKNQTIMLFWFVSQLSLYFFLYPLFLSERVRFVQTLFFVPLAYGTTIFLILLSQRIGRWFFYAAYLITILSFIPQYFHILKQDIFSFTDFQNFSVFIFPTVKQVDAYRYLDQHTPKESRVLASYEAGNQILLFSHNFVWGNPTNWGVTTEREKMVRGKDKFYSGVWDNHQALTYLKDNHIDYVYYGYQELFSGNITNYSFLKPVFTNKEATIFEVTE